MFPAPVALPNSEKVQPYVFVGDEAFRLDIHMMKPYSRSVAKTDERKAIFNYRLSRARRVSENAFALLSQVFRIFYTPINLNPETVDNVIIVICCLHNLLRDAFLEVNNKSYYDFDPNDTIPINNIIALSKRGGMLT